MNKNLIVAAFALAAVGANAQETQKSAYSVTTDFTYTSRYVFRGIENTTSAFQPSVELSAGDAYIGVWTNQPVTRKQSNEVDVYGGYQFRANENLSFEAVGSYYYYPEARSGELHDSYEGGLGASYEVSGITTSVYGYYDFRLQATTLQGSIGYSYPLKNLGTSLDFSANYGTVFAKNWGGTRADESYNYFGADVSLPYHLSEKASVVVAAHYAGNDEIDLPSDRFWYSVGVSVGF